MEWPGIVSVATPIAYRIGIIRTLIRVISTIIRINRYRYSHYRYRYSHYRYLLFALSVPLFASSVFVIRTIGAVIRMLHGTVIADRPRQHPAMHARRRRSNRPPAVVSADLNRRCAVHSPLYPAGPVGRAQNH
jgi:hypothetical protein